MFKLIVFAIIFYVIYRAVKKRIIVRSGETPDIRNASEQLADEMVQDPFCKSYFPRKQGVAFNHQDETLLFCSQDCLGKFRVKIETT